jgi:AraC family transcriptional regulator
MVCPRCIAAVAAIAADLGLPVHSVELGEIALEAGFAEGPWKAELATRLAAQGFELLDDRRSRLISRIKALVVQWVHYDAEPPREKYSVLISQALLQDYPGLSRLFSETEGITIEQFIIRQKTERVKELLSYDELTLSQIADLLGYSSVAHLSAQFRKVTGMAPSAFKGLHRPQRVSLDSIGNKAAK